MKRISRRWVSLLVTLIVFLGSISRAQQAGSGPGIAEAQSPQTISSRVLAFSDGVAGQPDGALSVTFAVYGDQQGSPALWTETQVVQITQGRYSVLLGSTSSAGLPSDVFSADQAHWLGVQINGTEKRYLLVSVPYAMKAVEAERLGGLLPSQFVTVSQLQTALNNAATASSSSSGSKAAAGVTAQASTNPPQPATDFTDNNTSEVLLVTQQGTGFAIHAISAGDAAIFAENSTATGTALKALASSTTGTTTGILGQSASPNGIAGVFDNTGGGQILSLRAGGNEVASVDNWGNFRANQINGGSFFGSGMGLFGIPPSAVNAQSANVANTIVLRDSWGSFSANQVSAGVFSGNGFGLFGIPPSAVNAQSDNVANSIVMRDSGGSFTASQINASLFSGNGFGLFGIPPSAVNAQSTNVASTIVMRDATGSFTANQINASVFFGNGIGLFGITPSGVNAQSTNVANTIVMRDQYGNFTANQINGSFIGLGNGLFGIPPSAVNAQSQNVASSIVMRDASGSFSAGGIQAFGTTDFTAASSTSPVKAVTAANTPTTCFASRDLLIKTDAAPGQQLFICNATGNGYVLVGDGTAAGVTSVGAADSSVAIGGTAATPTIAVSDGGITSAKLAANAVSSANVADGTLTPAKIAGTAATLGSNTFTGTQSMPSLSVSGGVTVTGGVSANTISAFTSSFNGSNNYFTNTISGTALTVNGGNSTTPAESVTAYYHGIDAVSTSTFGVFSSSTNGIGLHADGPLGAIEAQSLHGVAVHAQVDGGGEGNGVQRIFTGTTGPSQTNVFSVDISGNLYAAGALLATYPTAGTFQNAPATLTSNGQATVTDPNSTSALGIAVIGAGGFGTVYIATSGFAPCLFDGAVTTGDYVGISRNVIGRCTDLGSTFPSNVQVLGRVLQTGAASTSPYPVYLFGGEQHGGSSVMTVNTGPGLVGGPITSIGTVSIANAGVTNSMLLNNSLVVNPGAGLSGGGTVPLGGSITLNNTGALSFNGRSGNILPATGDYSFSQLNGTAASTQLPASVVYKNQSNTFTADQTINGTLNGTTANLQNVAVNTTSSQFLLAPLQVNDNGGAPSALYAYSQNHKAAAFQSTGPVIVTANNFVEDVFTIFKTGEVSVLGGVTARAFTGDGSALFNVNASSVGGISSANVATTSALTSETSARQSADTTLQSNIDNEGSARQSADAALATSISAETAARQSDVSNLQTTINSLSAGDAKLAASNTFTAGRQDFSGAGATLPVRALLSSQTPASCVAGKELLIKTDAPAGQQLFICDAGGATWNLVGDGASGGVTSFNGRNGSVSSSSGDYSFSQISGSAAASQLPANVVYSSQANTFSASQTVNGNMTASAFIGNGGGLSNVNAAMLNNLTSTSFAQLGASSNTFTGSVTAASFSGNGSAVTNVNAATVNNLQMLKLATAITPAAVGLQSCNEQSFNVPGINNGDVLLSVQLATHSPGTNIAIGGWRVSGANTVAIQFCNVSRSSSTPAAGTYTFALLR